MWGAYTTANSAIRAADRRLKASSPTLFAQQFIAAQIFQSGFANDSSSRRERAASTRPKSGYMRH
jgi:hypothetical protein